MKKPLYQRLLDNDPNLVSAQVEINDSLSLKDLGTAIKDNTQLKNLGLVISHNTNDFHFFTAALAVNSSLIALSLDDNEIDDGKVLTLTTALTNNRTLTSLDLSNNEIGDEGASALQDLLRTHRHLHIELTNNPINHFYIEDIQRELVFNQCLQPSFIKRRFQNEIFTIIAIFCLSDIQSSLKILPMEMIFTIFDFILAPLTFKTTSYHEACTKLKKLKISAADEEKYATTFENRINFKAI